MLSSSLLSGFGIGVISTGLYALITDKKRKEGDKLEDKKMEYCIIFCIIMLVSVLILFFTGKNTEQIIPLRGSGVTVNNNPPF
jgi:hypothetical protein